MRPAAPAAAPLPPRICPAQRPSARVAVLGVVALLILPLPALALASAGCQHRRGVAHPAGRAGRARPLDFSVFPTLLLVVTLFRLGLNVATTASSFCKFGRHWRRGHIIQAFGQFTVGGSLIVVRCLSHLAGGELRGHHPRFWPRGRGRSRFTLDACLASRLSIDADLAAGIIDDREARARRANLEREISSRRHGRRQQVVRAIAIAGLIITLINIVAAWWRAWRATTCRFRRGRDLHHPDHRRRLVSQMPALLVSTAAGITVTRASSGSPWEPKWVCRFSVSAAR